MLKMNILLLEDDELLQEIILEHLLEARHSIEPFYDGLEAYECIIKGSFDLLVLDVDVPSLSGFELLLALKEQNIKIPTIFITSLNSGIDIKKGFDLGCDDYLKKPFELVELDARIDHISKIYNIDYSIINIDEHISVDKQNYTITNNGKTDKISKKELSILLYMLRYRDRFISNDELISNIWQMEQIPSEATIRTYIKNLRSRLGAEFITTIKGVGYKIK